VPAPTTAPARPVAPASGSVLVWTTTTPPPPLPVFDYAEYRPCPVCHYDRKVGTFGCGEPCL
jgi:hypothetical protein